MSAEDGASSPAKNAARLRDDEAGLKQDEAETRRKRGRALPAWLDHFNSHDLKILFRCWAATWAASILVFIGPSLRGIGVATFFAAIILYIVPPASILFIYLLAAFSGLFGMCLAWAWGLLAMKAALAARPASETLARVQALRQLAAQTAQQSGASVAWEAEKLVHDGFMLDARVTVVFYAFCGVFVYALTRLRYSNPNLTLTQIFAVIVIDVFLLIGPTLTTFNASLASLLVKPGAIGIGLGAVCCLVFFPQSTSYVVLHQMEQLIRMTETSLDATKRHLAKQPMQEDQLTGARHGLIGAYKSMEPALAFLPLDLSRGRWNADDVRSLQGRVREVMLACLALLDLHIARVQAVQKRERLENQDLGQSAGENGSDAEKGGHGVGRHQLLESANLLEALKSPEQGLTQECALNALRDTTADVLRICSRSMKLSASCIHTVNACRWIGKPPQQKFDELARELQEALTTLRSARKTCVVDTTEAVIESHAHLFDDKGQLKFDKDLRPSALQGIVVSMVIEERILGAAVATERLLEHMAQLYETRTSHRIWLPSRLQYALSWLSNRDASISVSGTATRAETDPDSPADPVALEGQAKEAHRRLRFSRGSRNSPPRRGILSRAVVGTYKWFTNPAGIYALRMLVVTIGTAIPAAVSSSAGFYYREKLIWTLITAQTSLVEYTADFTFSLVSRGLGTVAGGVFGVAAWYIGSGNGPGNPYGLSAVTAVFTAIIVWLRIFLPPAFTQTIAMLGATFILIIGFSYDHSHIMQYGLPGIGYQAFWKRLVTVLVGFVASIIVQLFPRPPSATSHVCKTLANTVCTLADHYSLLLSHWGRTEQNSPLGAVAEQVSLKVAETLLSLDNTIALLKVEFSFGAFDQKVLKKTQEQCQYMNQSLGRLLALSASLPKELQDRLVRTVGLTDDRIIGEVMSVLGIIEQSLRTGCPLPERLPTPLIGRSWHAQSHKAMLSKALIRNEDYRQYCVAFSSYIKFLSTVDDLVLLLKETLGECHVIHRWEDA